MIYNFLSVISTLLFSVSFIFLKLVQNKYGTSVAAGSFFRGIVSLILIFAFIAVGGFSLQFEPFSLLMATLSAAVNLASFLIGIKSLHYCNVSVYTLFTMLGGMLLPFFTGMLFYDEQITWFKGIGLVLIAISLFVSIERNDSAQTKRDKHNHTVGLILLIVAFITNGLSGVITDAHAKSSLPIVDAYDYMAWLNIICLVMCAVIFGIAKLFIKPRPRTASVDTHATPLATEQAVSASPEQEQALTKPRHKGWKAFGVLVLLALIFGLTNGGGNYILTEIAPFIDSSIKYPIVTGGSIIFSTLGGLFVGEKINFRTVLTFVLVLAGTTLFMF